MMGELLKDRSGSMFLYTLIILIFLFTFSGLVGEFYRIHSVQTHVEYELQRAVNIAVEDAMKDSWRQDKLSKLDTAKATQSLTNYFNTWLKLTPALEKLTNGSLIYSIRLDSVTATEDPPRLSVGGKIIIPSAYPYLITNIEVPFSISSRNRRLD